MCCLVFVLENVLDVIVVIGGIVDVVVVVNDG